MKEHPILFDSLSVSGILTDAKTQTRRVILPQPHPGITDFMHLSDFWKPVWGGDVLSAGECVKFNQALRSPYAIGDRLWVRERWRGFQKGEDTWLGPGEWDIWDGKIPKTRAEADRIGLTLEFAVYDDGSFAEPEGPWRPSIFLPRWACRLVLEVMAVRVERLQAISPADMLEEIGREPCPEHDFESGFCVSACWAQQQAQRAAWRLRWDSINARRGFGWDANPWVRAISFCVVEGPSKREMVEKWDG